MTPTTIHEIIQDAVRYVDSLTDKELWAAAQSGFLDRRALTERGLCQHCGKRP